MRGKVIVALIACSLVCGCEREASVTGPGLKEQGRYSGIGTYTAGRLWSELAGPPISTDASAARLSDDDQVIVVIDSHTGEVRQCGNYSGVCVTLDPWSKGRSLVPSPTKLNQHAADLAASDEAVSQAE